VPAGVLEVVGVVRTILLPFALLALGAGLAIVHRMAAWTRDGFAERTVHVAQWTIPIGAVALLALGSGWPAAWRTRST